MSDGEVRTSRAGDVVMVTFDRPAARNAMTWQMYERLGESLRGVAEGQERPCGGVPRRGRQGASSPAPTSRSFLKFTSGEDGIAYEEKMEGYLAALEALPMPTIAVIEEVSPSVVGSPSRRAAIFVSRRRARVSACRSRGRLELSVGCELRAAGGGARRVAGEEDAAARREPHGGGGAGGRLPARHRAAGGGGQEGDRAVRPAGRTRRSPCA